MANRSGYSLATALAGLAHGDLMQVNVFITREVGQLQNKLFVLPASPEAASPPQHRVGWVYHATTNTGDRMFGDEDAAAIEAQLARQGYAIVKPGLPYS